MTVSYTLSTTKVVHNLQLAWHINRSLTLLWQKETTFSTLSIYLLFFMQTFYCDNSLSRNVYVSLTMYRRVDWPNT